MEHQCHPNMFKSRQHLWADHVLWYSVLLLLLSLLVVLFHYSYFILNRNRKLCCSWTFYFFFPIRNLWTTPFSLGWILYLDLISRCYHANVPVPRLAQVIACHVNVSRRRVASRPQFHSVLTTACRWRCTVSYNDSKSKSTLFKKKNLSARNNYHQQFCSFARAEKQCPGGSTRRGSSIIKKKFFHLCEFWSLHKRTSEEEKQSSRHCLSLNNTNGVYLFNVWDHSKQWHDMSHRTVEKHKEHFRMDVWITLCSEWRPLQTDPPSCALV